MKKAGEVENVQSDDWAADALAPYQPKEKTYFSAQALKQESEPVTPQASVETKTLPESSIIPTSVASPQTHIGSDSGPYIEAVIDLLKLTNRGELKWRAVDIASDSPILTSRVFGGRMRALYEASVAGRVLRLAWAEESPANDTLRIVNADALPASASSLRLAIYDDKGEYLSQFPLTAALVDLFAAAKRQQANLVDFFSQIHALVDKP